MLEEISSSRWIVEASKPVVSVIRLAARPVGAASRMVKFSDSKKCSIALIVVVLPVPGPPVMMKSPFLTAQTTACSCSFESSMELAFEIRASRTFMSSSSSLNFTLRSMSFRAAASSV